MLWGGVLFIALLFSFLLLSTTFISCAGGAGSPASGGSAEATSLCIQLPTSVEVPAKSLARTAQYAKVDSNFETFTVSITSSSYKSTKSCGRGEKLTFSNIPVGHYDVVALAKKADGAVTAKGTTTVDVEADVTKTVRISLTRLDYHTVQFLNADGSEFSTQDISDGYKATKPANPAPVSGKSFSGWTTDTEPSDTSPLFDFNTAITGDITLRPVFGVITYTVKYVSPVGSFTATDFTAATASSYSLPSTSSVTGLTFVDWYADAAFSSSVDVASVRDITTFTKKDDIHYEKTIYAKWTAKVQFKGENVSTHSIETIMTGFDGIWYGAKVSNPGEPTVPSGATFGGWYTGTYNESTGKVTFGSEYDFNSAVTEDITLYAKWNFVMHNVTYVSVPRAVPTGTATEFREIEGIPTLPTISSPTAAGCSFVGWTQDENFTLDTTPITSIPENTTTDVTLYAIWKVGVYFMNDLGSTTSFVVYGGALTKPTDPTKSGATFGGWFKGTVDGEGNVTLADEAYDFDDADKNKVTKSIDLYPKWDYVMHNVTYVSAPKDVPDGTATEFKEIQGIPTLPTITPDANSGLTFVGWTQDADFTLTTTPISSVPANTSTDVTLYAIWKVAVNLDARNGGTPSPTYVQYGKAMLSAPTDPTNGDSEFKGWFKGTTDGSGKVTLSSTAYDFTDTTKTVTESFTLYAKWIYTNFTGTVDELVDALFKTERSGIRDVTTSTLESPFVITVTGGTLTSADWTKFVNNMCKPSSGYSHYYKLDLSACSIDSSLAETITFGNYMDRIVEFKFPATGWTKIANGAFTNCQQLTSITIPNTVTEIGSNAFKNCLALTSIDIPESVKKIYDYTGLISLENVTVAGTNLWTERYASSGNLIGTNKVLDKNYLYSPSGSYSSYVYTRD